MPGEAKAGGLPSAIRPQPQPALRLRLRLRLRLVLALANALGLARRVMGHGLAAVLAGLLLALAGTAACAQDVQAVPVLKARVVDTIGWLSAGEREALEAKLAGFEAQAGPQIVVLLVATTAPEDIGSYAQRVADHWKIGRREVGDGVLLVAARDDRKLRIEVAKALEGAVPDLAARQIIANNITPAFKRGEIAAGLGSGVDALTARIRGEHLPAPTARGGSNGQRGVAASDTLDWQTLAMFFFVGVPVVGGVLSAVMGRKLGSVVTAGGAGALAFWLSTSLAIAGVAGVIALLLVGVLGVGGGAGRGGGLGNLPVILGRGGGGFGGGGRGGGGGFSSGGGGDFGGGGASGSW